MSIDTVPYNTMHQIQGAECPGRLKVHATMKVQKRELR